MNGPILCGNIRELRNLTGRMGMSVKQIIDRNPERHREDALQEANLARLLGRRPQTAVRNYFAKQAKHEQREIATEPERIARAAF